MSERKRYPEHERQYPWLGPLLETYHRTDRTVQKDLKKSGKKVACGKGCDVCCHNMGVPITEPEVPAVSWYVVEMMRGETRDKLIREIEDFEPGQEKCPFLVDSACGIYAVRPLACRTFHVFNKKCQPGESIVDTRPQDFYIPPSAKLLEASRPLFRHLGFLTSAEQDEAFHSGFLESISHELNHMDWKTYLLNNISIYEAQSAST